MKYQHQQLDNGLQIVCEGNDNAYSTAVGFFVRAGARDEDPRIGGVSHFLEHMLFKGTPNRSAEDVNRELDEMGSHSNARTSEESTIYHATVLPDFQSPVVSLLADIMRPSLRDEDFETEKQVIIEEILMYQDQPPYGGHEKIMEEFFGQHPLGQSVLGTVETVGEMTSQQMREYFQTRYSPDNIALVATGNVDFEQLVEDAKRCCGDWAPATSSRSSTNCKPNVGFHAIHKSHSTQEYIMQLAPGPSKDDDRRYATRALATILGDDSGSRIYWEFVDTGRAESAGMAAYEYQGAGLIMTFIACAPDQAQENIDRLGVLQHSIAQGNVSQRELELAKSKIASHIILASERSENRLFAIGGQWLSGRPYQTAGEIAKIYNALTLEQINAAAKDYRLLDNTTVVVGPAEDLHATDVGQ